MCVRFKVWVLFNRNLQKAKNLYNCSFLKWLRNSLIYNTIKVLILIILVLTMIFAFAPRDAFVSYISRPSDTIDKLLADEISCNIGANPEIIELTIENNTSLTCNGGYAEAAYDVDGMKYSLESYTLKVRPSMDVSNDLFISGIIIIRTLNDYPTETRILTKEGVQQNEVISSSNYGFSIKCPGGLYIFSKGVAELLFVFADACLVDKLNGEEIPVTTCKIVNHLEPENYPYEDFDVSTSDFEPFSITINENTEMHCLTNNSFSLNATGVSYIEGKATGTFNFSYSPNSNNYQTLGQIIQVASKDQLLDASINSVPESDFAQFKYSGIASGASISNHSLFPTFPSWYRDNIYLAPLTLVSTIIGGIALMLNKNKKADKSRG